MSKPMMENQQVAAQIEKAAQHYAEIKKSTQKEIEEIKSQLLDLGVPGSTVVKLKPTWQPDVDYLLRTRTKNPE